MVEFVHVAYLETDDRLDNYLTYVGWKGEWVELQNGHIINYTKVFGGERQYVLASVVSGEVYVYKDNINEVIEFIRNYYE